MLHCNYTLSGVIAMIGSVPDGTWIYIQISVINISSLQDWDSSILVVPQLKVGAQLQLQLFF